MARIVRRILISVAAVVAGLVLAIQLLLNSPLVPSLISRYVPDYIDGDLGFSRIRFSLIRHFPNVSVTVEDLSLTYPHDRFAAFDTVGMQHPLLSRGRGADMDTLAAFGRLHASVNVWRLLRSEISVGKVSLEELKAYAHSYDSLHANWNMFITSDEPKDTASKPFALPWIKVGDLSVSEPRVVYTDGAGAVFAEVGFDRLSLSGAALACSDSIVLDGIRLGLDGLSAGAGYGWFSDERNMIDAGLKVDADIRADGIWTPAGRLPDAEARLMLSDGRVYYAPLSAPLDLSLAAQASVDHGRVDADVTDLRARTRGLNLDAELAASDVLGKDPALSLDAAAHAVLDSVMSLMPKDFGILASGAMDIDLDARAHVSELSLYKFDRARISGHLNGDRIRVRMPADTLNVDAFRPSVDLASASDGILLNFNLDSIYVNMGADLKAKVRSMRNSGRLFKVESNGRMTPRLEFESDNGAIFFKSGATRAAVRGARIAAAVEKRVFDAARMRRKPGAMRREQQNVPDQITGGDIRVAVDSSILGYLKQWKPSGEIALGNAFVATPALPLRTRIGQTSASFDDREILLDTMSVHCGTSDISASGRVSNFMGLFTQRRMRRPAVMRLNLDSRRINVNELIAAMQIGSKESADTSLDYQESFVLDSIAEPVIDSTSGMGLFIVPGNIDAELKVNADRVTYTDVEIQPLRAAVNVKDRTIQILNTSAATNIGDVTLDAYYSTKVKSDISAGVDLVLRDISADGIIHMLPSVDEMMPALKSFSGKLGCEISGTTQIDTNMNVVIPSVDGVIRISGHDLEVEDAGDLRKITRLLLFRNKNIGHIEDLDVSAVVHDSKVEVFPFELAVDRYRLALRGMQSLDNTMSYHVSILKSPFLIPFGINMYGTLDNWRFNIGFPKYREGRVPAFSKEIESVRFNIAESIRNIFQRGVEDVKQFNREIVRELNQSGAHADSAIELAGTMEEYNEIESVAFSMDAMAWEEELASEVDAVLEASFLDTEKLLKSYQEQIYDKKTTERIKQLKEESDRKKKNKKK